MDFEVIILKKLLLIFMIIFVFILTGCEKATQTYSIIYPDSLFETYLSPYELDNLGASGIRITGVMEYHFPSTTSNFRHDWDIDYDFDIYYNSNQQVYMDYYFLRSRLRLEQRDQTFTYDSWVSGDKNVVERLCVQHFCDFTTLQGSNTETIFDEKTNDIIHQPYFILPTYGEINNYDSTARLTFPLSDFIDNDREFINQFLRFYEPYTGDVPKEEYAGENAKVSIYVDRIDNTTVQYLLVSDYYYYDDSHLYRFQYKLTLSLVNSVDDFDDYHSVSYSVLPDESINTIDYVYPDRFDTTVDLPNVENNFLAFNLFSGQYEVRIRNIVSSSSYRSIWYNSNMKEIQVSDSKENILNIESDGIYYLKIIILDESPPSVLFQIFPQVS